MKQAEGKDNGATGMGNTRKPFDAACTLFQGYPVGPADKAPGRRRQTSITRPPEGGRAFNIARPAFAGWVHHIIFGPAPSREALFAGATPIY